MNKHQMYTAKLLLCVTMFIAAQTIKASEQPSSEWSLWNAGKDLVSYTTAMPKRAIGYVFSSLSNTSPFNDPWVRRGAAAAAGSTTLAAGATTLWAVPGVPQALRPSGRTVAALDTAAVAIGSATALYGYYRHTVDGLQAKEAETSRQLAELRAQTARIEHAVSQNGKGIIRTGQMVRALTKDTRALRDGQAELKFGQAELHRSLQGQLDELQDNVDIRFNELDDAIEHGNRKLNKKMRGMTRQLDGLQATVTSNQHEAITAINNVQGDVRGMHGKLDKYASVFLASLNHLQKRAQRDWLFNAAMIQSYGDLARGQRTLGESQQSLHAKVDTLPTRSEMGSLIRDSVRPVIHQENTSAFHGLLRFLYDNHRKGRPGASSEVLYPPLQ